MSFAVIGEGSGPAVTLPLHQEPLTRLFEFIAKGMAWYHWRVVFDQGSAAWSGILNLAGEAIFNPFMSAGTVDHVGDEVGAGTFAYAGTRARDNPQMSAWVFTIYGGLEMSGDPDAPHERVSKVGVLIASKAFIARFNAFWASEAAT